MPRAPSTPHPPPMVKIEPAAYPRFSDDLGYDALGHGIAQNLSYLIKVSPSKQFAFGEKKYSRDELILSLERFLAFIHTMPSEDALIQFIATNYDIYQSTGSNPDKKVLFTGYYEPTLNGSLSPSEKYAHPVYPTPDDLITIDLSSFSARYQGEKLTGRLVGRDFIPYFDRKAISYDQRLKGSINPIAWVDDPIDLFFLHIQGSGTVFLDSGKLLPVHYHATNGQPYRSIGKWLIDHGKIERSKMSMQAIRKYLQEHPDEMEKILCVNHSYVFFKTEPVGPLGCLEVPLTPGRSLALDRRLFPLGTLSFIQTQKPVIDGHGNIHRWVDCARFVVNQDTGGAIRGAGRADLFWGNGAYAEIAAGHMQHTGKLFFLVLKKNLLSGKRSTSPSIAPAQ